MPRADWRFIGSLPILSRPWPSRPPLPLVSPRPRRRLSRPWPLLAGRWLLGEYRARLIADVVAGKCEVREAMVGLPVED